MKFAVAGAGFSGAVLARELAEHGHQVTIFEARSHVAGNCYTERDPETGVLVHVYGPHIFHTADKEVWAYVNRYSEFRPYTHRVKTTVGGQVYSMPVNLHTINQFFGKTMRPDEAREWVASLADSNISEPQNFEEQALHWIGPQLYEAFFKGYTEKQWGMSPTRLPASILKRLPLRFDYNDNYFSHPYQGMPVEGYTPIVEKILDHASVEVRLNTPLDLSVAEGFDHAFYTGPIDSWYGYSKGRLAYRTLDFEKAVHDGDYQGVAVMNYGDQEVPFTRITEHKYFEPWASHGKTVTYKEFSRECGPEDIPYYPIRMVDDKEVLKSYVDTAMKDENVSFMGRLGTYRYIDMDVTIAEALTASREVLKAIADNAPIPVFFVEMLD